MKMEFKLPIEMQSPDQRIRPTLGGSLAKFITGLIRLALAGVMVVLVLAVAFAPLYILLHFILKYW